MPTWLIAFALMAVSVVVSALIRPKAQTPEPAKLADFEFPQDAEGTPEMVVFGDVWIEGWFVIWYGNLTTQKVRASDISDGGGKK